MIDRVLDWAARHPHLATVLTILAFIVFVILSVLTKGIFFALVVGGLIMVALYWMIYSTFNGTF